ncbi:MAG: ROK family protein [Acidimicrobiales bacterium]
MGAQAVLAFDFGGSKVSVALSDLGGRRILDATIPTRPAEGARWNFDQAVETGRQLIARAGGGSDGRAPRLAAVGACTFGIPTASGVLLAPAIPGWGDLVLDAELSEALECPLVRVGTDVKAAAQAEALEGALVGADPAVYLNLGTGLAVGIVFGGQVVAGANRAAGEIGYNLRQPADLDLPPASRARLEDVVSGMALAAAGSRAAGAKLSAADVFEQENCDGALSAALDGFVRELSFHLVNLVIAIDPARVAVGGGIVRSWDRIEAPLRAALSDFVPFPPALVPGAYPYDAALVGAINLGVQAARQARRARSYPVAASPSGQRRLDHSKGKRPLQEARTWGTTT